MCLKCLKYHNALPWPWQLYFEQKCYIDFTMPSYCFKPLLLQTQVQLLQVVISMWIFIFWRKLLKFQIWGLCTTIWIQWQMNNTWIDQQLTADVKHDLLVCGQETHSLVFLVLYVWEEMTFSVRKSSLDYQCKCRHPPCLRHSAEMFIIYKCVLKICSLLWKTPCWFKILMFYFRKLLLLSPG